MGCGILWVALIPSTLYEQPRSHGILLLTPHGGIFVAVIGSFFDRFDRLFLRDAIFSLGVFFLLNSGRFYLSLLYLFFWLSKLEITWFLVGRRFVLSAQ